MSGRCPADVGPESGRCRPAIHGGRPSLASPAMEFTDAVRRRRMVRSFSGRPVPGPLLDRSSTRPCGPRRPGTPAGWDAVVLRGPAETASSGRRRPRRRGGPRPGAGRGCAGPGGRRPLRPSRRLHRPLRRARQAGQRARPRDAGGDGDSWPVPYWFVDTGFAALLLLLGAVDAGLGACFLGNFRGEAALARRLGVPGDRRYLGTVLLGEPGGDDPPSAVAGPGPAAGRGRRPLAALVAVSARRAEPGAVRRRSGPRGGVGIRGGRGAAGSRSAPGGRSGPGAGDP